MTSLLRTCSSFALAVSAAVAGNVTGQFQLSDSVAPEVRQKNYSGIVVWLEPLQGKAPAAPSKTFTIVQKGKRFIPHVTAMPIGSTIDLPNYDPIFHNAFSNFAGQPFDTGLYAPGTTYKVRFQRQGVVRVFCNIHSTMSAVVVVTPSPWYAVTNKDGSFQIENVPAGDYTMKVWHERASQPTLQALEKRVTVADSGLAVGAAQISESRFTPETHKNKYGRDYGPEPPDRVPYGAAKK